MKYIIFIAILFYIPLMTPAQYANEGRVVLVQDDLVDSVLHDYEAMRLKLMGNPDNKAIPGYRIQIFFDSGLNSSDRAGQVKEAFQQIFPEIPAYVSWKAPNYRVRVGDFRTRLEAERNLQLIIADYPNAWVIKDEINFPIIN